MGFFDNIFGSKKLNLQDDQLGEFTSLNVKDNKVLWNGETEFLESNVSVFLSGTPNQLDTSKKELLLNTLQNQAKVEIEIDKALKEQFENADKSYSKWENHFNCISISIGDDEVEISFEEKESFYHFNVQLSNNKVTGVSIDS